MHSIWYIKILSTHSHFLIVTFVNASVYITFQSDYKKETTKCALGGKSRPNHNVVETQYSTK